MLVILVFIFGISIGSFLNVVIDRLPRGENLLTGRSKCESCNKTLAWYDLVPVISYVSLLGHCRYCKTYISSRLVLVELITGFLFVVLFLRVFNFQFNELIFLTLSLFIVSGLVTVFFIDLNKGIILDSILIFLLTTTLLLNLLFHQSQIFTYLLTAIGSFIFFFLIHFLTKGKGMGFGDVKFSFFIGFFLGFPLTIIALYAAFLTGGVASIILILLGKKKLKKDTVPFGPFLVLGVLIAYFWGEKILALFNFL